MPSANSITGMFHRRLILLLAAIIAAMAVLAGQLTRLTVVQGAEHRARAEAKLVAETWIPTLRGRVLDRKGRVLAHDRPSFDVAVEFPVITGRWAEDTAAKVAKRLYAKEWPKLSAQERRPLIEGCLGPCAAHLERMWTTVARETGVERGELEVRKEKVIAQVDQIVDSIQSRRHWREVEAALSRGLDLSGEVEKEIKTRTSMPIDVQTAPHAVLRRIGDEAGFSLRRLAAQEVPLEFTGPDGSTRVETVPLLPGLSIVDTGDREYPYEALRVDVDLSTLPDPQKTAGYKSVTVEGVAVQVLGWLGGQYEKDDLDRRERDLKTDPALRSRAIAVLGGAPTDRGRYMPGDQPGRTGVEASAESELRGLRGLRVTHLDTGESSTLPPEPGRDVRLTIDVLLQARVQAAMSPDLGLAAVQSWHGAINPMMPEGTPLNGAAVVLDIESGEILALVSTPTFSRATLRDHPERIFEDTVNLPFLNRAVARPYPPGSIVKALILCGAVQRGNHAVDRTIDCTGHLLPGNENLYRCWIFKRSQTSSRTTHTAQLGHPLDAAEALMVSCNIFFFTLGQRLGVDGIVGTYRDFGVPGRFDLGIGVESEGNIGTIDGRTGRSKNDGSDLSIGDATQMGIGQGPVAWTPLHAANAYATLARGGVAVAPRVVAGPEPAERRTLGLDSRAVEAALEGLRRSVNEPLGTGHHVTVDQKRIPIFNVPGVRIWGKTGTAAAKQVRVDPDGEGPDPAEIYDLDHSWFVVLVGPEGGGPRYAIAVMMEYGGSGGKVSGPVCNQIIHALRAEGYL